MISKSNGPSPQYNQAHISLWSWNTHHFSPYQREGIEYNSNIFLEQYKSILSSVFNQDSIWIAKAKGSYTQDKVVASKLSMLAAWLQSRIHLPEPRSAPNWTSIIIKDLHESPHKKEHLAKCYALGLYYDDTGDNAIKLCISNSLNIYIVTRCPLVDKVLRENSTTDLYWSGQRPQNLNSHHDWDHDTWLHIKHSPDQLSNSPNEWISPVQITRYYVHVAGFHRKKCTQTYTNIHNCLHYQIHHTKNVFTSNILREIKQRHKIKVRVEARSDNR